MKVAIALGLLVGFAFLVLLELAGCSGAGHIKPVVYFTEQAECVAKYDAAAPMNECINAVRARYGRLDGGSQ